RAVHRGGRRGSRRAGGHRQIARLARAEAAPRTHRGPSTGRCTMDRDPLIEGLAGLAAEPPPRLLDRIAARWTHADSAVGEVFVAFTDQGVAYVRRDGPGVADAFRERFGRPLLAAERTPDGLLTALRTGDAAGLAVDLSASTGFQADVLPAARPIPPRGAGPYAWVAARIRRPRPPPPRRGAPLRLDRRPPRPPARGPRGRHRAGHQPGPAGRPVPPGDPLRRHPGPVHLRRPDQGRPAGPGTRRRDLTRAAPPCAPARRAVPSPVERPCTASAAAGEAPSRRPRASTPPAAALPAGPRARARLPVHPGSAPPPPWPSGAARRCCGDVEPGAEAGPHRG